MPRVSRNAHTTKATTNLRLARVQGIEKALGMKGQNFNTALSVFFCGYILGQIPSNIVMSKISRPSLYLCCFVMLWGMVSALTGIANDYSHLIVTRFFLGMLEAPFFPGVLFLLSSWYTKRELALRTSILYTGAHLSGAWAGLIAAGIQGGLDGARGKASWRWLFIIEGVITIFMGLVAIFILPDYPGSTWFLSEQERKLAQFRLRRDVGVEDYDDDMPLRKRFLQVWSDYKVWLMALIYATMTTAGGYGNFVPTVIAQFGRTRVTTLLLTAPPYCVPAITELIVSYSSDRFRERCFHYTIPMILGIIGFIIAASTTSLAPRYLSIFFMTGGMSSSFTVFLAWIASTFPRPRTSRAIAYGTINAFGNMAQIWSPYLYPPKYGPRYIPAFTVSAIMVFICICLSILLRQCLVRENRRMGPDEIKHAL